MKKPIFISLLISLSLLTAGAFPSLLVSAPLEITVMTHDSFSVSKAVVAIFEKKENVKIRFLKAGDAGAALNQAILSKNNPLADVFYGVDNTFIGRALKAGIFVAYSSPQLRHIPDELKLDSQSRLLPVDFGDVCLNYDKKWFAKKGLQPPRNIDALIDPRYKNLTVVMNPATSSPGLAFLLTTVGRFGEAGYLDYWRKLKDNGVLVTNGWQEAYWGSFSAASKGNRPIVVSYASSPPAEVYYSKKKLTEAPTAAVTSAGSCFRQIEFAGILKGTRKTALAEKLIDFMLDTSFQEDIPLQMFVFPSNRTARLPEVFTRHTVSAESPIMMSPVKIASERENWIEAWTETVLR
ncbi:MAG: thiamine ABC transporter substrate-binding protein [Deltaproteobacteria bacterium]|nr:thiamine ABC transporter substrate-binding protein [Deltaproteobacteria bacterium]